MLKRRSKLSAARVAMAASALTAVVVVSATSAASGNRVGLAQPTASNDHSFGQAVHNGAVKAAKQFGLKLSEIENLTQPKAQATAVTNLARTNDIVLVDGA